MQLQVKYKNTLIPCGFFVANALHATNNLQIIPDFSLKDSRDQTVLGLALWTGMCLEKQDENLQIYGSYDVAKIFKIFFKDKPADVCSCPGLCC